MGDPTIRTTADLLAALELTPGGEGVALAMPRATWVYGGLLAGQALVAAAASAPQGLVPRSVSIRFLRRATPGEPVRHVVTVVADSTTFADRRVTVTQGGDPVAVVTMLLHVPDDTDLGHRVAMPPDPPPGADAEITTGAGFEVVDRSDPPALALAAAPPHQRHWMRAPGTPAEAPFVNAAVLVMASDLFLANTAWRPVPGRSIVDVAAVVAYGLTLTVWFHAPAALARWHLLDATSPVAGGGRALSTGTWFDADGRLVATVALDAVMRLRSP